MEEAWNSFIWFLCFSFVSTGKKRYMVSFKCSSNHLNKMWSRTWLVSFIHLPVCNLCNSSVKPNLPYVYFLFVEFQMEYDFFLSFFFVLGIKLSNDDSSIKHPAHRVLFAITSHKFYFAFSKIKKWIYQTQAEQ